MNGLSAVTIGQKIGSYRVLRQLGAGGMGVVYEALHEVIGRRVAIKVMHAAWAFDVQTAARFLNEARAANLIRHPGFVEIYEFGHLPAGAPFMVMEFLDGESLAHRLARFSKGVPIGWALDLGRQMATALGVAHERGIVHRDLKPENAMLVPDLEEAGRERVKILDLGIAKLSEPQLPGDPREALHTLTGVAMGTPQYMAPEQCLGARHVDGQADVYSLGVILHEALGGKRPFDGESALEVMNQQVLVAPTPLRVLRPDVPAAVASLVEKMLAKAAAERPSMREIAASLGRLLAELPRLPAPIAEAPAAAIIDVQAATVAHTASTPCVAKAEPASLPFIIGPPIFEPHHFIGRQRELRRLCNLWRQPPLQNAALIGPRRAGKTSILLLLKNSVGSPPLRRDQPLDFLPRPGSCQFVYVDFQDPRMATVDGVLRHLLSGLQMPTPPTCELDRFMDTVAGRLATPTVLLFDEIGVALERYQELDAAFWEGLRALATNQTNGNLGFVLASHRPPHELAQKSLGGSPFFNIFGYCATVGPFSEAEARSLIALSPLPIAERDIVWMLEQSRRWPILLQSLCRERLLALQEGEQGDGWRDEALAQLSLFAHLLKGSE